MRFMLVKKDAMIVLLVVIVALRIILARVNINVHKIRLIKELRN